VSGDARRCLDICRRAVEIAEADAAQRASNNNDDDVYSATHAPGTPSKTGRGRKSQGAPGTPKGAKPAPMVTIATIKQAIAEATSSPLQRYLRALPLSAKVFLAALLARVRRSGVSDALVGDVLDEARRLAMMTELSAVREVLLFERGAAAALDDGDFAFSGKKGGVRGKSSGLASRMVAMEDAVLCLTEAGIIGAEMRRGERGRRVRLIVGDEEVRLAYKEDEDVEGLGFQ
jgi:origin recognition complex subunit 1